MSGSESDYGWGKKDQIRDVSSPYRPDTKRLHSNESFSDEPVIKKQKTNRNSLISLTQPPMLLFKHFLNQQEEYLLVEEAMRKYNEYKESFACDQLKLFFETHKEEEWFKEKYHPEFIDIKEKRRLETVLKRKNVFQQLQSSCWLDELNVHVNFQDDLIKLFDAVCIFLEGGNENDLKALDKKMYRPDSPIKTEIKIDIKQEDKSQLNSKDDFIDDDGEKPIMPDIGNNHPLTENVDKKEPTPVKDQDETVEVIETHDKILEIEPRPLHKNLSIYLPNVHSNAFKSQLEEIVKQFPGYLRIGLQDPLPDRQFMRRGWVTFAGHTDMTSVLWQLKKHRLVDLELGAIINKDNFQRIRPIDPLVNHRAVMRQDVKYAAKLVGKFDKRRQLWNSDDNKRVNPLLKNITEYLVDEGSYEEEAYLGGNINNNLALTGGGDPHNIAIEEDFELAKVLDKLILYLRIVHSFDYYSATEYTIEDELPSKCGLIHARGNPLYPNQRFTLAKLEDHMKQAEARAQLVLDSIDRLDFEIASRLGVTSVDEAVDKFVQDNTKEISTDKWLCPLSGKKFKGPEFVKKHIFNKFADRIEHVKETVQFFNNYVLDPRRPQLPEHPSNRPKTTETIANLNNKMMNDNNDYKNNDYNYSRNRGGYDNGNRSGYENGNRFNNRNNYGVDNNRDDVKMKSYYSRKLMNYNDVEN